MMTEGIGSIAAVKYLKSRTVRTGDAALLVPLFKKTTAYNPDLEARLPLIFDRLFEADAGVGIITQEITTTSEKARCVGFTYMGFMKASAIQSYISGPVAGMAGAFLSTVTESSLGAFKDRKEQAAANLGDGIDHALIALCTEPMDLVDPDFNLIFNELYTNYLQNVRGYNIRSVLAEVDVGLKDFMIAAGLTPQVKFDEVTNAHSLCLPENALQERWFMRATRNENHLQHAMSAAVLMSYIKPALRLTPSEQRLLLKAIEGLNDNEIAEALGITRDAVKSSWKTIYAHVADVMPILFANTDDVSQGSRGSEKRRRVVAHVRTNLQELRPHYTRRNGKSGDA